MAVRIGEEVPDALQLLRQIGAQVEMAKAALQDENEGAFSRAVFIMEYDAQRLAELVVTW